MGRLGKGKSRKNLFAFILNYVCFSVFLFLLLILAPKGLLDCLLEELSSCKQFIVFYADQRLSSTADSLFATKTSCEHSEGVVFNIVKIEFETDVI
jgi:hypothetical protein